MQLDFLDVGHGSSVVLRSGRRTGVVDLGREARTVWRWLSEHIRAERGRIVLDAVVVTHLHKDHYGGLSAVLGDDSIDVKALYVHDLARLENPRTPADRALAAEAGVWCARTGRTVEALVDGAFFELDGVRVQAIWPRPGGPEMQSSDENRRSIVLRVEGAGADDASVLLTGDATPSVFKTLLENRPIWILKCDVLLFPHHGGGCGDVARSQKFAQLLGHATGAVGIVIQNGARFPKAPHPHILAGLRTLPARVKVLCTQLSMGCGSRPDDEKRPWCAGRITLMPGVTFETERQDHPVFIRGLRKDGAESAQCVQ